MSQIPCFVDQTLLNQEEGYLYDPGAERGLLACIMQRPELLLEAERQVTPDMLFIEQHSYSYKVMSFVAKQAAVYGWQLRFDEVTVLGVAKMLGPQFVDNFMRKSQGMERWREIAEFARYVSLDQFARYIATIKDRAARVAMFRTARQLQRSAMDMVANPTAQELAYKYEAQLSQVGFGAATNTDSQMRSLGDYADESLFEYELNNALPDKHLFHVRTPMGRFDYWMSLMGGGFRRNSLTIVAARMKVGKTSLLLNLAMDFALAGIPVLFLDTEMSGPEMVSRELSNIADLDEHDLIAGKYFTDSDKTRLNVVVDAVNRLKAAPFKYVSVAGKPVEYGLSVMRQFRNNTVGTETINYGGRQLLSTKPCVVFYDWLKLPTGSINGSGAGEHQLLGDMCSMLKDGAKALNLPVIAGAQQNRGAVGKEENDHAENAEAYIANSDRLAMFCSTLCVLRNPSIKMAEEIAALWPNYRKVKENQHDSAGWKFNQIFQVVLQRQGRDCRYGIPFYIDRGHARYEEITGLGNEDAVNFLKNYSKETKARAKAKKATETSALPPITSMRAPDSVVTSPTPANLRPANVAA